MLPTKFQFIWSSGFRGEDLNKSAHQKQELPVAAMLDSNSCVVRKKNSERNKKS
jgi:hypothetical protein